MIDVFEVAELAVESFDSLESQEASSDMPAVAIPGQDSCYFARSSSGEFYLLIASDHTTSGVETRFESLRASGGSSFTLASGGAKPVTASFAYVCLESRASHLISSFGLISGVLLNGLPANPSADSVNEFLADFLELFALHRPVDRSTVVGLWGEMWVIDSFESEDLAGAWHSQANERFDFSRDEMRLEVKTTEGSSRLHSFSLDQLMPHDKPTYIASLTVVSEPSGRSIADLLVSILGKVSPGAGTRVSRICLQTMSGDLEAASDYYFSLGGRAPLAIFDAATVPRVDLPEGLPITDVRFKVDLTTVPSLTSDLPRMFAPNGQLRGGLGS